MQASLTPPSPARWRVCVCVCVCAERSGAAVGVTSPTRAPTCAATGTSGGAEATGASSHASRVPAGMRCVCVCRENEDRSSQHLYSPTRAPLLAPLTPCPRCPGGAAVGSSHAPIKPLSSPHAPRHTSCRPRNVLLPASPACTLLVPAVPKVGDRILLGRRGDRLLLLHPPLGARPAEHPQRRRGGGDGGLHLRGGPHDPGVGAGQRAARRERRRRGVCSGRLPSLGKQVGRPDQEARPEPARDRGVGGGDTLRIVRQQRL